MTKPLKHEHPTQISEAARRRLQKSADHVAKALGVPVTVEYVGAPTLRFFRVVVRSGTVKPRQAQAHCLSETQAAIYLEGMWAASREMTDMQLRAWEHHLNMQPDAKLREAAQSVVTECKDMMDNVHAEHWFLYRSITKLREVLKLMGRTERPAAASEPPPPHKPPPTEVTKALEEVARVGARPSDTDAPERHAWTEEDL